MPKSTFAVPSKREGGKGGYPIPDIAHGRNALARVAQHGTPAEKSKVRAAVKRKFPSIKVGGDKHMESPYCVEGGAIRTSIGVAMPSLDTRILAPTSYPAGDKPKSGPAGDAKHVKI